MFDLDTAIADWRRQMFAAGIKSPAALEELESHLRAEIDRQTKSGLSENGSFETAARTLGQARAVQNEFRKVEESKEERAWKRKEILVTAGPCLVSLCLGLDVLFRGGRSAELTSEQQMSGLVAIVMMVLLAWGGRLGYGIFPIIAGKRNRAAVGGLTGVLLAVWWVVFFCLILPRHDFTMAQFLVAFLWAFVTPAGAFTGLIWGMETAARKKAAWADS